MKRGVDFIGVGVGAFVLSDDKESVLLVKRKTNPEKGYWSIPGGSVEFGETFEQAVCREVFEETGIQIVVNRLLCLTDHIVSDGKVHWVTPSLEAIVKSGELVNREPEKHEEVRWFKINDLPDKLTMPTLNALKGYRGQRH